MNCDHNLVVTGEFDCWIGGDFTCSGCGSLNQYNHVCCRHDGDQDLSGVKVHVFTLKHSRVCVGCNALTNIAHTVCGKGWFWQAADLVKSESEIDLINKEIA